MDSAIIKGPIMEMLKSKKFIALLIGVIITIAAKFGFTFGVDVQEKLVDLIMVYIGAQGVADAGKGFAAASASVKAAASAASAAPATPAQP